MDTILVKDVKNRVTVNVAEKGATGPAGPQGQSANLPPANSTTLGGIIVGDNLSITGNGVLSAQPSGVTAFNNRTGNVSLTSSDVTTLVNANYLQVYKDTQANESGLTQFGLSSFIQSGSLGSGYSRGLLTSNVSGTTTRSIFDGNVYQSSAAARYPAFKRIAFNSNNTSGANSTGRIQVNDYGAVFIDSQTLTSGSNISRVSAFSVGSATSFQNSGDILLTSPGVNFYALKSNNDGSNVGNEQGTFSVSEMQRGVSGPNGTYISRPYTVSFESRNTWPVADTTISYSYTPNYRTFMTIGDSAELFFQHYGNLTTRNPTWTSNSILTQGYADTRYQPVGAYLTSANLTYANITGTPDLTAYVKKTQNATQTIASTASIGSDSSTLTLSSSSYGMSVTTLAGTSNLTVTPTAATLVLAGGGTWTANSILTLGYADGRYLTSANLTYANITGKPTFATVATSGSYTDLSNTPTAYSLPTATNTTLGGIKVGANLSISNGVLSAVSSGSSTTSLPWANITSTPTTLAGYGITDGLTASNLTAYLTSATAASTYLPIANFTYANITGKPTLATVATSGSYTDLTNTPASYSLPTATTSVLGGVKVDGSSIVINSGIISSTYSYTLPAATTSTLGGVRLGAGVNLDANGFLISDVKLGTNTFTGTQNLQDNELIRAKLRDYSETVSSPTISAGTLTLNLETSNIFTVALNAAITTLTISNPPASGSGGSFTLIFTADGTARAVTWPASIKWAGGTAPTLTSTSGKVDSFAFFTSDGGTNWQGYVGGQNF